MLTGTEQLRRKKTEEKTVWHVCSWSRGAAGVARRSCPSSAEDSAEGTSCACGAMGSCTKRQRSPDGRRTAACRCCHKFGPALHRSARTTPACFSSSCSATACAYEAAGPTHSCNRRWRSGVGDQGRGGVQEGQEVIPLLCRFPCKQNRQRVECCALCFPNREFASFRFISIKMWCSLQAAVATKSSRLGWAQRSSPADLRCILLFSVRT